MKWGAGLLAFAPADGPMANCVASGKVIEILGSSLPEMTMLFAGSWRKQVRRGAVLRVGARRSEAADLFRPIHDRTGGVDGWVSLEVSPLLAHNATGTLAQPRLSTTARRGPIFSSRFPQPKSGAAIALAVTHRASAHSVGRITAGFRAKTSGKKGADWKLGRCKSLQAHEKFEEQSPEQPFAGNKNGSHFGCLACYWFYLISGASGRARNHQSNAF
jgi:hypothetical protein